MASSVLLWINVPCFLIVFVDVLGWCNCACIWQRKPRFVQYIYVGIDKIQQVHVLNLSLFLCSAMNSGSGSLAIGELIGAAFFIVSVVSGCMGIIRPFRSKRITFMRDASFLTGAIMILTWIVYHQRICWYHGLILICYYITYVIVVVMGAYRFPGAETPALPEPKSVIMEHCNTEELLTETSRLLQSTPGKSLRFLENG